MYVCMYMYEYITYIICLIFHEKKEAKSDIAIEIGILFVLYLCH